MDNDIERRFLATPQTLEEREGSLPKISGYAVVFDSLSDPLPGGFREVVRRGAFTQWLSEGHDVIARVEHRGILGRTSSGTLRVTEDVHGLKYEVNTPNTSDGRDAVELIKRGDLAGSSFAFAVRPGGQTWGREKNGDRLRSLTNLALYDVSPVLTPAYASTDVALRSLAQFETEDLPPIRGRMWMRLALAERN